MAACGMRITDPDGGELVLEAVPSIEAVLVQSLRMLRRCGYSAEDIGRVYGHDSFWVTRRAREKAPVALVAPDIERRLAERAPAQDVEPAHGSVKPNSHYVRRMHQEGYDSREIANMMGLRISDVKASLRADGFNPR